MPGLPTAPISAIPQPAGTRPNPTFSNVARPRPVPPLRRVTRPTSRVAGIAIVEDTYTADQAVPSDERYALNTFPRRESFNHFGAKVVPPPGPSLSVAPPVAVLRRNF